MNTSPRAVGRSGLEVGPLGLGCWPLSGMTRAGITPFDDDVAGEYRCPHGDTIGLNLLSEVTISASSRGDADFVASRQFLGRRAGLLRPLRCIFVSQKVRQLFEGHGVKAYRLEVVRAA